MGKVDVPLIILHSCIVKIKIAPNRWDLKFLCCKIPSNTCCDFWNWDLGDPSRVDPTFRLMATADQRTGDSLQVLATQNRNKKKENE